ncbi:MAG: vWA domain-containing protein, partial [Eubacterium sp.]
MVKKIISAFIVLVLIAIAFPAQVFAKQDSSLGRIYIYKPSVKVELYNVKDFDSCSVNLSNEKLKIEKSGMYDAQEDKSLVYLLIDLSSSMNPVRFESVKKALCNFVKDMPEQDSLVLITFGESVKTVLNGEETVKERVNAISSLKCNQNQTTFYEALKKVYNDSIVEDDTFDRRFAIVVSDGVDVQKGSATKKEVTALYNNQGLPLFSLCDSYNTASTVNDLGELSRSSGADIFLYADNDASTVVSNLYSYVYKNVALIEARANSNDSNGKKQMLSVTIDNQQYSKNVEVLKSSADKEAPSAQIEFDDSDYYTFTVEFSEPVNNADKIDSYTISNSKGKELAISSVKKISDTEYKLTMKHPVTNGDYTFDFNSITDKSVEKNPADSTTLNSVKSDQYTKKLIVIFAAAFIAFASLIAVIIVLAVKAKNKKQN